MEREGGCGGREEWEGREDGGEWREKEGRAGREREGRRGEDGEGPGPPISMTD